MASTFASFALSVSAIPASSASAIEAKAATRCEWRAFTRLCFSFVVSLLALWPWICRAQLNQPSPSVLTSITVDDSGSDHARILLGFDAVAPKFSMAGNDTEKPAIALALTSRANTARSPAELHNLLGAISLDQTGTFLIIRVSGTQPLHLAVKPLDTRTIALDLTKAQLRVAPTIADASQGPPRKSDTAPGKDIFEIVPLKYADVSEVVGLLVAGQTVKPNDSFTPHEPSFGSAGAAGSAGFSGFAPAPVPQGPADQTDEPLAQSVNDTIGIDRRLNAIVLQGPPDQVARLKQRISVIDVPVQSVVLETTFVELDRTGARNLGFNFNNSNGQIGIATLDIGGFSPSGADLGKPVASGSLQAALYAQIQSGRGRIVSRPRISALSGTMAKIVTGDALPILTSIALSGVNGVSQQVQYVNVGVTLQIAPRVSSDGNVTSHIFCVVSSVSGYNQGYPTISQREAQTSATVHDGETFVIGGLTEDDETRAKSHLPVLSDIPLLGSLFDLQQDSDSKTELYIVVTPHIAKPDDAVPASVASELGRDEKSKDVHGNH